MQNVIIFLIVAAILSLAAAAERRLLARETAAARRAANLSRYLPAEKVAALEGRDDPFEEERDTRIAILFTDIVGFNLKRL